eukprot:scaffold139495_cov27-Prasinocladus_malaysianus.AAC.1
MSYFSMHFNGRKPTSLENSYDTGTSSTLYTVAAVALPLSRIYEYEYVSRTHSDSGVSGGCSGFQGVVPAGQGELRRRPARGCVVNGDTKYEYRCLRMQRCLSNRPGLKLTFGVRAR